MFTLNDRLNTLEQELLLHRLILAAHLYHTLLTSWQWSWISAAVLLFAAKSAASLWIQWLRPGPDEKQGTVVTSLTLIHPNTGRSTGVPARTLAVLSASGGLSLGDSSTSLASLSSPKAVGGVGDGLSDVHGTQGDVGEIGSGGTNGANSIAHNPSSAEVQADRGSPALIFYDPDGEPRFGSGVVTGTPFQVARDRAGVTRLRLGLNDAQGGAPEVLMADRKGSRRVAFTVPREDHDPAGMSIFDDRGWCRSRLDGGGLSLLDDHGVTRLAAQLRPEGESVIELKDAGNTGRVVAVAGAESGVPASLRLDASVELTSGNLWSGLKLPGASLGGNGRLELRAAGGEGQGRTMIDAGGMAVCDRDGRVRTTVPPPSAAGAGGEGSGGVGEKSNQSRRDLLNSAYMSLLKAEPRTHLHTSKITSTPQGGGKG